MKERLHYLDWLRVIAILILHFYHTSSIFTPMNFMIQNIAVSPLFGEINQFFHEWRLALLFLISGAGSAFALGIKPAGSYLSERTKRLLVPLLFGVLVVVPPQIYIERISQGFEFSSFLDFYRGAPFSGLYPYGNISWHHLWFVGYLFVYSLMAVPLFIYCRNHKQQVARFFGQFDRPGFILLWSIPIIAAFILLSPISTGVQNIVNDSSKFLSYFLFFIYGYLFHMGGLWEKLANGRQSFFKVAFLCILVFYYLRWTESVPVNPGTLEYTLYFCLKGLNSWAWVITIMGYGVRYLNIDSPWIKKANQGVYPFYILHQTIIVLVAYYVLPFHDSTMIKYSFISLFSLFTIVGLLIVFIYPFRLSRFLFGMKRR